MQKLLLTLFSILFITSSAVCQDWQWVKEAGGTDFNESKSIATDANGNSYVTGNFANSITIGNVNLTGSPNGSTFVAKYDSNGGLVWAKAMASTSVVESMDIAADAAGNTYLTGNFKGTASLGAFTLTSPEDRSAFVAKLDQNGNIVWAKQADSPDGDVKGLNVTVDVNGNAYVTGNFFKTATFGSTTIKSAKDEQLFIAKYSSRGDVSWVKMAGGLGSCFTHDMTTDKSGNLYLAGQFWMTAVFGSSTLTNYSEVTKPADIFLAKYDANGNALWAKQAGGTDGNDVAAGIAVDADGNSYITGFYQSRATFGTITLTGNAAGNIFLAKYNTTGTLQWVKKQEGASDARGVTIDRDSNGNLYVAGHFEGSLTFGSATLVSRGSYDMFFAKYDANGNVTGAIRAGGEGMDLVRKLHAHSNGGIYFVGDYSRPATFGATTLSAGIVTGKIASTGFHPEPSLSITTGALSSSTLCRGATVEVPFSTTGSFGTNNVFTVQLSNSSGSFTSPVNLGSGTASPIRVTIPAGSAAGTGYRVRVVASSPAVTGSDNGANLTLPAAIAQPGAISGQIKPCAGASGLVYSVPAVAGAEAYTWTIPGDWSITTGQGTPSITVTAGRLAGDIAVRASNPCSYAEKSLSVNPVSIDLAATVTSGAIAAGTSTFLAAQGADSYTWSPATGLSNAHVADPVATPSKTTTYTVTGVKDGCTKTAQVTVVVKEAAVPANWVWANQNRGGADSKVESTGIATDVAGNIYVTGNFCGEISFGTTTLTALSCTDIFVVKYTAAGNVVWARRAGNALTNSKSKSITTDPSGNVYITGDFGSSLGNSNKGKIVFGGITLTAGSEQADIFVTKYDPDGKVVWARNAGGLSMTESNSIASDAAGNLFITGGTYGETRFGSYSIGSGTYGMISFIAKYDNNGNVLWAKHTNEGKSGTGRSIAMDKEGNCYTSGYLSSSSHTEGKFFVSKSDNSGNDIWTHSVETVGSLYDVAIVHGMAVDEKGEAYITGTFSGRLTLGKDVLNSSSRIIFTAKYDAQGSIEWGKSLMHYQSVSYTSGKSITTDKNGNVYITGISDPSTLFNNEMLGGAGSFVARYDVAGNLNGAVIVGGRDINRGHAITTDNLGNIYLTGLFKNEADFEGALAIKSPKVNYWEDGDFYIARLRSVNTVAKPTVIMGTLPASYSTCSGEPLSIPFTTTGNFQPGNTFKALLSDKNGSFLASTPIGEGTASPIKATIPAGVEAGSGYKIKVIATSPYIDGEAGAKGISITTVPQPAAIAGNATPCPNEPGLLYAIPAYPGAVSYKWTLPVGWDFMERPETSTIKVIAGTRAGYISVSVTTSCGTSAVTSLYVSPGGGAGPAQPASIVATKTELCAGTEVVFKVDAVEGATGYTWAVPAGWQIYSGQGTAGVAVKAGVASGIVTVVAYNACGQSKLRSLEVSISTPPAAPSVVAGTGCVGSSVVLTAAGAWTEYAYYWYTTATGGDYMAKGATFTTPTLTATTTYYVSLLSKGGCESPRTAVTATIVAQAEAEAGRDETVCFSAKSFALTGYSPVGGKWSGPGVAANGVFDPAVAGVGQHELTYTYSSLAGCTASDKKIITVREAPVVTLADFDPLCSTVQNYVLSGGQPAGGVYSGLGVRNGLFTPVDSIRSYPITYTYTNAAGCAVEVTKMLTVTTCTGMAESKSATKLVVYPNPTRAYLNVALPVPVATDLAVKLYDTKGRIVFAQQHFKVHGEFKQVLDLQKQAKGIYLLQLVLEDGVITRRVVLE